LLSKKYKIKNEKAATPVQEYRLCLEYRIKEKFKSEKKTEATEKVSLKAKVRNLKKGIKVAQMRLFLAIESYF
jgi:hypothetical protein